MDEETCFKQNEDILWKVNIRLFMIDYEAEDYDTCHGYVLKNLDLKQRSDLAYYFAAEGYLMD